MFRIKSIDRRTGKVLVENTDTSKIYVFVMKHLKSAKIINDHTLEMQDRFGMSRQSRILD